MGSKSSIEWTDATWSPLRARVREDAAQIAANKGYTSLIPISAVMAGRVGPHCEAVSHGCDNCYSATNNHRCLPSNGTGLPFDRRSRDLIEPFVDEKALTLPLRWRAPKKIFVENQSDLFGEWVTDEQIDRVFAVMALCPQHTFQVLTKRPERMLAYFGGGEPRDSLDCAVAIKTAASKMPDYYRLCEAADYMPWPYRNIWLGVSVENQATGAARREPMKELAALGWITFCSYEPALGPVNWHGWEFLRWLIIGGESGPGARPFDVQWARDAILQCHEAGVPPFFKQAGAKPFDGMLDVGGVFENWLSFKDRKGGDWDEWPEGLRVREYPL